MPGLVLSPIVKGLIGLGLLKHPADAIGQVSYALETRDLAAKVTAAGWEIIRLLDGHRTQ